MGSLEFSDLLLERMKLFFRQSKNAMAWDTATIAHLEDLRQLRQGEPELESAAYQSHAINCVTSVDAVTTRGSWRLRKDTDPLIVTDRIRADSAKAGKLAAVQGFAIPIHTPAV